MISKDLCTKPIELCNEFHFRKLIYMLLYLIVVGYDYENPGAS